MDYSELDKVRRTTTPLQLDAVESFARGRLTRREFITRGTIVGLSMASISAVIAACGGTTHEPQREQRRRRERRCADTGASGRSRLADDRWHDPDRLPATRRPARPGRDDRPRRATG